MKNDPQRSNSMNSFNNQTQAVVVTQNYQELHYISPETIMPFGGLSSIFGLIAIIAMVVARKSKSETAIIPIPAYAATGNTTRSFNSRKFYEDLDTDPYESQYSHWGQQEATLKKSAKDMTREEILAEAGLLPENEE
jgi:hypothetical protein